MAVGDRLSPARGPELRHLTLLLKGSMRRPTDTQISSPSSLAGWCPCERREGSTGAAEEGGQGLIAEVPSTFAGLMLSNPAVAAPAVTPREADTSALIVVNTQSQGHRHKQEWWLSRDSWTTPWCSSARDSYILNARCPPGAELPLSCNLRTIMGQVAVRKSRLEVSPWRP